MKTWLMAACLLAGAGLSIGLTAQEPGGTRPSVVVEINPSRIILMDIARAGSRLVTVGERGFALLKFSRKLLQLLTFGIERCYLSLGLPELPGKLSRLCLQLITQTIKLLLIMIQLLLSLKLLLFDSLQPGRLFFSIGQLLASCFNSLPFFLNFNGCERQLLSLGCQLGLLSLQRGFTLTDLIANGFQFAQLLSLGVQFRLLTV